MTKRFLIGILAALTATPGLALEVERTRGRLYLYDRDCSSALEQVTSVVDWSKYAKVANVCDPASLGIDFGFDRCGYDITDCVPDHVVKYHGARPGVEGPNCWNLALVMSEILPSLRYSPPEEMVFYMAPPLCRQLGNQEPRRAGDVGAIRTVFADGTSEEHGFVYISEKLTYSKNGSTKYNPYALQDLESVYRTYGVPDRPECRRNEIDRASGCNRSVAFFRCQPIADYLREAPVPPPLQRTIHRLSAFEDCLEKANMTGDALSDTALRTVLDVADGLAVYLTDQKQELLDSKLRDEERDFVLGSLQLRLYAISEQLGVHHAIKESADLTDFLSQIRKESRLLKKGPAKALQ